jgi:hypothetical protein
VSALAKYGSVAAPIISAAVVAHSDTLVKVGAVVGGLALGAMWRAGSMRGEGKPWGAVRSDLAVSGLIGGANAVLCLALVELFDASEMFAMAIAVIVGATGLRALPEIKKAFMDTMRRKLIGDDVALMQPRNVDIEQTLQALRDQEREGE